MQAKAAPNELPILFVGDMVRAILSGAKTQTRREFTARNGGLWPNVNDRPGMLQILRECKFGKVGDRLWVRETCRADELLDGLDGVRYMADDHFEPIKNTEDAADQWLALHHYRGGNGGGLIGPTVPSIHMPRWASRLTLEITGLRVERLQDISEADAIAEGIEPFADFQPYGHWRRYDRFAPGYTSSPADAYASLWESINGPGSWESNPWVWAIEFKRV